MCRRPIFLYFTLPLELTRSLFAADFLVFILGILTILAYYWNSISYNLYFLLFGLRIIDIKRPSIWGFLSTLYFASSSSRLASICISTSRPISVCAISRPRNRTVTLTLFPPSKNSLTCLVLNSRSCFSIFGCILISLSFSCFCFFTFFFKLKLIFTVIKNFAYRRICLRRYFHKVGTYFLSYIYSLRRRHNAPLFTLMINYANFSYPDLLIDP